MMVPVDIYGVHLDPSSGASLVLLGERTVGVRVLPIFIGPSEAQSIAIGLAGVVTPRPLTHDLMLDALRMAGVELTAVDVTELRDGTFFAELEMNTPDGQQRLSARPSDGLALAVRVGVPISVERSVLDEAGIDVERDENEPFSEEEIERVVSEFHDFLARAEPADFGEPGESDIDERNGEETE